LMKHLQRIPNKQQNQNQHNQVELEFMKAAPVHQTSEEIELVRGSA
jgi:hypothetical protein